MKKEGSSSAKAMHATPGLLGPAPLNPAPQAPASLNPAPFPKDVFGNRRSKAKGDLAALLARTVFEFNLEAIYEGLSREVIKGNATVFKALAERGYGKLQESEEFTQQTEDMSDAELDERIRQLERELGFAREADEAGRADVAAKRRYTAKGKTKN